MNHVNCENIRIAAMVVADNECPQIPISEIEFHLAECDDCRIEIKELNAVIDLLKGQRRRERTETVWDRVEEFLRSRSESRRMPDHWPWFLMLGLALAGYRCGL
jgi:predicted anti-sigma-YlaC factor YlaD